VRRREIEHDRVSRVAVLADVHGNPTALEAVATEVIAAAPDLVVFLGDLTWGPLPEDVWAIALTLRDSFAGARSSFAATPSACWVTPATPARRMRALLAGVRERVLVSAHTHIQFDRCVEGVRFVNPDPLPRSPGCLDAERNSPSRLPAWTWRS
jgi:hypothetical protein